MMKDNIQFKFQVSTFQPSGSGIVINNYFNCKGEGKSCNYNVINVSNRFSDCG